MDRSEYVLCDEIASGGIATVHLGRRLGAGGLARVVAIKRMCPEVVRDPELVQMIEDEARLAACIRHPNVVPVLDVVHGDGELLLVLEYVHGESLSRLLRAECKAARSTPGDVAVAIAIGVLEGLHAAHEARGERGEVLGIVHRDVSPQNILVAAEGVARVLDFGAANAAGKFAGTRAGVVSGKAAYMAPEQLSKEELDRRSDVYATSIVLWEMLTGERLFDEDTHTSALARGAQKIAAPSEVAGSPSVLDAIVLRGLARKRADRYATARAMAAALEAALAPATPSRVAAWLEENAGDDLRARAAGVARVERGDAPGTTIRTGRTPSRTPLPSRADRARALVISGAIIGAVALLATFFAWYAEQSARAVPNEWGDPKSPSPTPTPTPRP